MPWIKAGEADPLLRSVTFFLVSLDGITPALDEAGGQPQVSINRGDFADAGIGVLVAMNAPGWYRAVIDLTVVAAGGVLGETRYKGPATAECPGQSFQVVGFDPADGLDTTPIGGKTLREALWAIAADAAGNVVESDDGTATEIQDLGTALVRIRSANTATTRSVIVEELP